MTGLLERLRQKEDLAKASVTYAPKISSQEQENIQTKLILSKMAQKQQRDERYSNQWERKRNRSGNINTPDWWWQMVRKKRATIPSPWTDQELRAQSNDYGKYRRPNVWRFLLND
jgi:hypothetical protein